jgi:hypothetical protein
MYLVRKAQKAVLILAILGHCHIALATDYGVEVVTPGIDA